MTSPHDNGLPRRRARVLVPLHGGLGFGSEAILARALDVARKAQDHAARNVKAVAEAPLAGAAATKHTGTLTRPLAQTARDRDPLAFAPEGDERRPATAVAAVGSAPARVKPLRCATPALLPRLPICAVWPRQIC